MKNISNDEAVKWLCLFECLLYIQKQCEKNKLDYEVVLNKKIKPNHIKKYIEERFPIICNILDSNGFNQDDEFLYEFLYGNK